MIEVKTNIGDLKVCTCWNDVSISQYQDYCEYLIDSKEGKYDDDKIQAYLDLISIFLFYSQKNLEDCKLVYLNEILNNHLSFIYEPVQSSELKTSYKMLEYEFEISKTASKLSDVTAKDMKAIQFIDYTKMHEGKTKHIDIIRNIHNELAVLMIPKGQTYGHPDFDVNKNAEIIRHCLNITDANAISDFFLCQFKASITAIESYLERQIKKMKNKDSKKELELMKIQQQIADLKSKKAL